MYMLGHTVEGALYMCQEHGGKDRLSSKKNLKNNLRFASSKSCDSIQS